MRVLLCFFSFQVADGIRTTFALAIDDNTLYRSEREYTHAAEVHRVDVEGPCWLAETLRRVRRGRHCSRGSDVDGGAGLRLCPFVAQGETIQVNDVVASLSVSFQRGQCHFNAVSTRKGHETGENPTYVRRPPSNSAMPSIPPSCAFHR